MYSESELCIMPALKYLLHLSFACSNAKVIVTNYFAGKLKATQVCSFKNIFVISEMLDCQTFFHFVLLKIFMDIRYRILLLAVLLYKSL
jgi:hypothetical protein